MSEKEIMVIYLTTYVLVIIYFVVLGCWMLAQRGNPLLTRGEQEAKRRMTRTMGVAMFVAALEWFIYFPLMLYDFVRDAYAYKILFNVMLMMSTPTIYSIMFAVVQRKVNILGWICALGAPFLFLAVWQAYLPVDNNIPIYIGAALSVASYIFLLIRFSSEYRIYVHRIRSEYSETTSREIAWSWICFSASAVQGTLYVAYELFWEASLEILYMIFTLVNLGYICFCISRQRTIDVDVVREPEAVAEMEDKPENITFYANIEQKLQGLCNEKFLFLNPDITLETLALRLSINRTYLGMYFRKRKMTFYQYINTLRVEYAYKLMQDNPHMSIRKVAEQSGFRSQTTFRKVFKEVMGCLPSEMKNKEEDQ